METGTLHYILNPGAGRSRCVAVLGAIVALSDARSSARLCREAPQFGDELPTARYPRASKRSRDVIMPARTGSRCSAPLRLQRMPGPEKLALNCLAPLFTGPLRISHPAFAGLGTSYGRSCGRSTPPLSAGPGRHPISRSFEPQRLTRNTAVLPVSSYTLTSEDLLVAGSVRTQSGPRGLLLRVTPSENPG